MNNTEQLLCLSTEEIFDWLGDREIFFCSENCNIFSGSATIMEQCFEVLFSAEGILFFRTVKDPRANGMVDVMGCMTDLPYSPDKVWYLYTHSKKGAEYDCVEVYSAVSNEWFNKNKNKPGIRSML